MTPQSTQGPIAASEKVDRVDLETIAESNESAPTPLANDLVGVAVMTMQGAGMAISMAALIFSGDLSSGLPRAIASFAVASGLVTIIIGLRSRIMPVALIVQDAPAIVLVAVAAQLISDSSATSVADVFVLLAATSLLAGIGMWTIGQLKLGRLVRYLPTTVIGAFMAGTGWLLLRGGTDVATGSAIGWSEVAEIGFGGLAKFWLPAMAFGVLFWLVSSSDRLPASAIGILGITTTIGFYVVTVVTSSVSNVEAQGWLIGPFPNADVVRPVSLSEVSGADWSAIAASTPGIASVIGITLVAVLLNLTGIGTESTERLNVDDELKLMGAASVVASPLGAAPTFHALGDTMLLNRLGVSRRAGIVATGAAIVVMGFVGVTAIGYIPRFLIAGLLMGVGLSLIANWVHTSIRAVRGVEQLLGGFVVVAIAAFGVLIGIGVGILAACAVFIFRYSRIDPFRLTRSGREVRSRVDRSDSERSILLEHGDDLEVYELQGFLFFGSVAAIDERLQTNDLNGPDVPSAVIVDFKHVTGVDVSAYSLIAKSASNLGHRSTTVIFSGVDQPLTEALVSTSPTLTDTVTFCADLDEALERAEEAILAHHAPDRTTEPASLPISETLLAEFEPRDYEPDTVVMAYNGISDGMLIVTAGQFTVFQVDRQGARHRLRRISPVTVVGEIGMIEGSRRTAEIVADSASSGLWLSAERYNQLRAERPELIFELHEFLLGVQAARVVDLGEALSQSMR